MHGSVPTMTIWDEAMRAALDEASTASTAEDVPVGAVVLSA